MKKHKIKLLAIGIIFIFTINAFMISGNVIGSEEPQLINHTINVTEISIKQENGFDHISVKGFGHNFIPGTPDLPSKIFTLAIPPNAKDILVRIETGEPVEIEGYYNIFPCEIPQTINGDYDDETVYMTNYEDIYSNDEPYPDVVGEFVRNAYMRKYDLVDVRISPCVYYPVSGNLFYYPEITIIIEYSLSDTSNRGILDKIGRNEIFAEKIIANYVEAQEWYPIDNTKNDDIYDYVIITLDSLVTSIQPLVDWEEQKERNVKVVTTSWIDSEYEGYDLQEKMRNFLREKYPTSQWGIEDVLLIGHYDDVPMRRCAQDTGYGQPETDYYYAELSLPDSESWDQNENNQYGENSDSIDFYTEVTVGRIPSSDSSMVNSICEKSVLYEQVNMESYKKNILLLAGFFWDDTDNAELMEEVAGNAWMSNWSITRMYESQSSYPYDLDLSYNNVLNNWSEDTYAFVNWAGHGSPTACYELYPSQAFVDTNTCNSLNDGYPAIIFADACSNQDTDEFNIGQAMMYQGAIGFLGSTKVAYGNHGWNSPYDGSSQSLDYFFTSRVTSCNYSAGQAHQWALLEMYTNGLWYYDNYEMFEWGAYLGNPNIWMSVSPMLSFSPKSIDFGLMELDETDQITIEIWNNGSGALHYDLVEDCDWITLSEYDGVSTGEHDDIILTVDTTGLNPGSHHYEILIDTIEAGKNQISIDIYVASGEEILNIEQNQYDRGFPIRHAIDGDWAAATDFKPSLTYLTHVEILMRKFGTPEFDLTLEIRENQPDGVLIEAITIPLAEVPASWDWVTFDFEDQLVTSLVDYFIVCPPAPSGVTTSFGYAWAYKFGNVYPDGAFWFTRDGGGLWRDLPNNYEMTFRIYGFE